MYACKNNILDMSSDQLYCKSFPQTIRGGLILQSLFILYAIFALLSIEENTASGNFKEQECFSNNNSDAKQIDVSQMSNCKYIIYFML